MPTENTTIDFSTILAGSVHDMKNSLAMLLGSISDIIDQCPPHSCPAHSKFHRMQHEAQRVNRDLVLLLTLYKMDQGQYFFNIDEVNVYDYLEEIILDYKEILNSYGINISLNCDPNLTGYFDRSLIASIIKTVISNAHQYTSDEITISADTTNSYTQISVRDNGPGYPEEMILNGIPNTSAVNLGTGSTGLGLYFSSRVAELHKSKDKIGYIRINNNTDSPGGCFSICLP